MSLIDHVKLGSISEIITKGTTPTALGYDFQREGISIYNITDVPTKLIAETTSDKNGFFQMKLQPGEYSIFVVYNGEIYADGFDGVGNIGKFSISEKNKTEYNFVVNNAVD